MTTWLTRWFTLQLLALPLLAPCAVAADSQEIERLVKQLGSDKFKEREVATTGGSGTRRPARSCASTKATPAS